MSCCLIGLGSNLGDRQATLDRALELLSRYPRIAAIRASRSFQTSPAGGPLGQRPYLNAAAAVETSLDPQQFLASLREIETQLGRQRSQRWGPRTLDLDLLLIDDLVAHWPELVIPHPRMAWRRFVLEPAAEVAGAMVHPTTGWTIARLLDHLNAAKNYVAIAGPMDAGTTYLAERVAQSSGAIRIAKPADFPRSDAFRAGSLVERGRMAVEFMQQEAQLLAADSPVWTSGPGLWVSDFWFGQWPAFARAWLSVDQAAGMLERWQAAAENVVRPKLTVVLDPSPDSLMEGASLGRPPGQPGLTPEAYERFREALSQRLRGPDVGPVLRLVNEPPPQSLEEVLAAVDAMK
jgi:2-amino-4-hydroxy-6-hydroxymethyldihydropteridine diphosphokinase